MITLSSLIWGLGGRRLGGPLSVSWGPGTVVLHGNNGCGKTTLLRTLVGVIPPIAGGVVLDGRDLARDPVAARRVLGWMPDRLPVPGTTRVGELLALVRWAKGLDALLPPLAEELGVAGLLGSCLGACSLGQQRRACFVAAMLGNPPVLLMDEPDRGLDPDGLAIVMRHIRARSHAGQTTVMVTHNPEIALSLGTSSVDVATLCLAKSAADHALHAEAATHPHAVSQTA